MKGNTAVVIHEEVDAIYTDDFIRAELAIEVISTMIGGCIIRMAQEKDSEKISAIEEKLDIYERERSLIYSGDEKTQIDVIEKYAPLRGSFSD